MRCGSPTCPAASSAVQPRRPFCPWVQWHEAGGARRCGWSWCLDALVPKAADASTTGGAADAEVWRLGNAGTTWRHFQDVQVLARLTGAHISGNVQLSSLCQARCSDA